MKRGPDIINRVFEMVLLIGTCLCGQHAHTNATIIIATVAGIFVKHENIS